MRALIQRVSEASVMVNGIVRGRISQGLLIFLGIEDSDSIDDIDWLSRKIVQLRIFNDETGVMNKSVQDVDGGILLISQFTLHASTKKGARPSYSRAAKGDIAEPIYQKMIAALENGLNKKIETGVFAADMNVQLINDGPVTIFIDTKNKE